MVESCFIFCQKQKLIFEYISSIYTGKTIENDRKALNGKEIDIYLPDLKLGFEFNGDFWHMNPELFTENYVNPISKIIAKDKWRENNNKKKLAKKSGITLIVIWENDWDSNTDFVENKIRQIISDFLDQGTQI